MQGCFEGSMSINNDLLRELRAEREKRRNTGSETIQKEESDLMPAVSANHPSKSMGTKPAGTAIDLTQSDDDNDDDEEAGEEEKPAHSKDNGKGPAHAARGDCWDDDDAVDHESAWREAMKREFEDDDLALAKQLQQEEDEGWGTFSKDGFPNSASLDDFSPTNSGKGHAHGGHQGKQNGESLLAGRSMESQNLTGDVCPDAHQMFLYYDE